MLEEVKMAHGEKLSEWLVEEFKKMTPQELEALQRRLGIFDDTDD
jgi:hypothetical protein